MKLPKSYQEKTPSEQGFSSFYQNEVIPFCEKSEQERQQLESLTKRNGTLAIIIGTLLAALAIFVTSKFFPFLHSHYYHKKSGKLLVMAYSGTWWLLVGRYKQKYVSITKDQLLPITLKFFGDLKYQQFGEFDKNLITAYNALPPFVQLTSQDHIYGEKDAIKFEMTEIILQNLNESTSFRGVAIHLKNLPVITTKLVIKPKEDKKIFNKKETSSLLTKNEKFNEEFSIFCDDEEVAKKFLDQDFCEKLLKLNCTFFSDKGLRLIYDKDQILFAIPCDENMFEPDFDFPLANEMSIRSFLCQTNTSLTAIDQIISQANKINFY